MNSNTSHGSLDSYALIRRALVPALCPPHSERDRGFISKGPRDAAPASPERQKSAGAECNRFREVAWNIQSMKRLLRRAD